tara:strand:- start:653 stop:1228 length:576 start_codon:yes stop_codon:yes gene_type:complete
MRAVEKSLEYVNHFDVAMVVFELYKSRYIVTNIKLKTWFCFKKHVWEQTEIGPYRELSSEVLQIFKRCLKKLKSSTKKNITKISNCEKVISILLDTIQKERICHECLYVFYDNSFFRDLDLNNNLIPFTNGIYDWTTKEFRDGVSADMLSIYISEPFVEEKCYEQLIKNFVQFRIKLVTSRRQEYDFSYKR